MPLKPLSQASHNQMLGRFFKPVESNKCDHQNPDSNRPAKRLKTDSHEGISPSPSPTPDIGVQNSGPENDASEAPLPAPRPETDIETALPPVPTNVEALEEYEAAKAAEAAADETAEGRLNSRRWVRGRSSIYVDAFNLALDTVLDEESHLFDEAEMAVFKRWREFDYEPHYVRLFLRKTAAWHRISSLGYHSDIADLEAAIEALQQRRALPESFGEVHENPGELEPPDGTTLGTTFTFADTSAEHITTLEEASSLLKLDELKALAKEAKVQGKNKQELLRALQRTSRGQSGLGWVGLRRSDMATSQSADTSLRREDSESAPETSDDSEMNRDAHFLRKIMTGTGPCIRLSLPTLKLFERVHLVFYRSSEWTEKSLTTIILAKIARRNFPEYIVSRSSNIFPSRRLLLEFEASLRTQSRVDTILESNDLPKAEGLQQALDVFEQIYPRWQALLREEQRKEESVYQSGEGAYLRRLSPAWVYTRIVHKAAGALGKLRLHTQEHNLLKELLAQRLFHASRRGAWYQRKALLEEHYMGTLSPSECRSEEAQKKHWKRVALQTCEAGLQDPLVHLIYHYDLQKRVSKLEKALKVAKRAQHDFTHVRLTKPVEVTVQGVRIEKDPPPPSRGRSETGTPAPNPSRKGRPTVWLDPLEDDGECSVEAMCLSHYRSLGWKGYHSEGGIVRTLFAYLFYDVLFTYVPNVFQTAYQTCPLDLHTDAFYPSRLSEINHRLAAISNGEATSLVQRVWSQHSDKQTCIVGLDWSFDLPDLLEIVECFNGAALATVCKVLAQEYGQRGGGVPDLFLWHPEKKEVLFAEVKSENDRLSDTQRLWIHVLSGAGIRVELCNATAKEVRTLG